MHIAKMETARTLNQTVVAGISEFSYKPAFSVFYNIVRNATCFIKFVLPVCLRGYLSREDSQPNARVKGFS